MVLKLYSWKYLQSFNSTSKLLTALSNKRNIYTLKNMETSIPTVFHSLQSVLDVFQTSEFSNSQEVQKLLEVYNITNSDFGNLKEYGNKKFPFIVFEGLDATGKTTISKKIKNKYNGTLMHTPPKSISHLRSYFEEKLLSAPFYSLGNYIAELEILEVLQHGPVILDRYWHSTAAFWLSQSIQDGVCKELPPKSDKIYTWPSDLLKPDIVIALVTTEKVRQQRMSRRNATTAQEDLLKVNVDFRKNIIQSYENMSDPKIEFVDSNGTVNQVVRLVDAKIKHLFN